MTWIKMFTLCTQVLDINVTFASYFFVLQRRVCNSLINPSVCPADIARAHTRVMTSKQTANSWCLGLVCHLLVNIMCTAYLTHQNKQLIPADQKNKKQTADWKFAFHKCRDLSKCREFPESFRNLKKRPKKAKLNGLMKDLTDLLLENLWNSV